jgi:hypothetical protein
MNMLQSNRSYVLAIGSLMLIAFCAALFSFSSRPGGDSISVSLNKQLLFQQYLHVDKEIRTVSLADASAEDVLHMKYSHCGQNGKDRNISVRDSDNKTLKQWSYADAAEKPVTDMSCKVKDILALHKTSKGKLNLVYSSGELPEGRTLISVELPNAVKASLR